MSDLWPRLASMLPMLSDGSTSLGVGRIDASLTRGIGWGEFDRILTASSLEHGLVRVIGDPVELPPAMLIETRMGAGEIMDRRFRRSMLLDRVRGGDTIVLNKADRLSPSLRRVVEGIEYATSEPAWVNGYACWGAGSAFGWHRDAHDVVIVQAEGTKHWRIKDDADTMLLDAALAPGDVLFLRAGTLHEVTGKDSGTLHWTFGFARTSPEQARLEALEGGTDPHLIANLDSDELVARVRRDRQSSSPQRRRGLSLPWVGGDVDFDRALLKWASRYPPSLSEDADGRVAVQSLGCRVVLPHRALSLLQHWRESVPMTVEVVAELTETTVDEACAFVRELITAGLLLVETDYA